ncbi:MAG: 1-acyl-sn-glycerol-3-phosphate acyltransferase [Thermoleophilaceae bacterium]|jgi:1-acyl-sn-glycerol-3-phosphate acyltransferase
MEGGGDDDRRADGSGMPSRTAEEREALADEAAPRRDVLRQAAVAKRDELRVTAAAKAQVLRKTALATGGELRSTAAAKGGELGRGAVHRGAEIRRHMRSMDVPWARCAPARVARETILQFGLRPLMGLYTRLSVSGRERFDRIPPPVVLVANHSSHLDTPTILRALPLMWRQRTAVAAAADYFYNKRTVANAVALIFNTVPIMRRGGGGVGNGAFDHVDRLIDQRWNLLVFPEGTRSREGNLGRLRSGAAVIAQRHGIPIVPIRIERTHDAMPPGRNWPKRVDGFFSRRHRVEVHFGPPIIPTADEDPSQVMDRVRRYLEPADGPFNGDGTADDDPRYEGRLAVAAGAVSPR